MATAQQTKFFPGDLVEVRSLNEILATLDDNGTLERLPFMPEMSAYAGRRFRVSSRAFKTCVDDSEMRSIDNTVFLDNVRCDGQSHGDCDKACLIFWKEAWLRPAGATAETCEAKTNVQISEADLLALANREGKFFCQSSEIVNASKPLPFWEPRQYVLDLLHNRISIGRWLKGMSIAVYNKIAHLTGRPSWRFVAGPGTYNGTRSNLNLQPGDLVRVKSLAEIQQTLDAAGKHHHLLFAPSMAEFCGSVMRVQKRVEKIILEATPRQREIKDTVLLEGATCDGICHRLCPRQSLLFWRECWLEKVNGSSAS
ncbi:MAG TPA: hypothetical protein VN696_07935 [Pyrinomonadaceae bacterium]|nr:hypothetical protein [Pyrinomonadaceae bacterium]